MKNIILIVSLLLMGVSSRADILNSSDNKNVADKFDPMLKAALFQMKIIADTSSILLSDIDYVEDLELKTSLWIDNDVNRAKTTRHEITSLKGLEYFSSLRRLKLVGNRTDTLECIPDFSRFSIMTIVAAMGQMFYSLSIGMGILFTYGSYMKKEIDMEHSITQVEVMDTLIETEHYFLLLTKEWQITIIAKDGMDSGEKDRFLKMMEEKMPGLKRKYGKK